MKSRILAGVAMAALLGASFARADDAPANDAPANDPPARVGRLADLSGAVSLRSDPTQPWAVAARNQPVTSGMSFWTEPQARAELQVGPTELHLGDQSELDIQQLDDQTFAAQLAQGSVNLDIADMQPGESYTVDTPRGTVTLQRPGEYRIDAGTTQDPTEIVVFSGEAQIAGGPDGPVDVQGGETGIANGTDPFTYTLARSADRSPLDDWADGRLHAAAAAPRYVSRSMTGYQDLDGAGTWHETPSYGTVWYPTTVPAGWVPYRDGRWEYDGRWGWTWVDDQPWGFAPFHYGRWAYVDDRWGWLPGPVEVRPVYAPALVSFFAGAAVGAAIGVAIDSHSGHGGPIGWYPLGPGEIYRPSYRVSDTYVRNVNVTNIRNVNVNQINIHNGPTIVENGANRRFATEVPERVLAERQPVAPAALQVPPDQLAKGPLTPVSTLPRPAAPTVGEPQAPHPAVARAPNGRLPLAAGDPNRPHAPIAGQPAEPAGAGRPPVAQGQPGTPGAPGTAQAQPGRPPLPGPDQHGPAAPGVPGTAQAQPGRPPLPGPDQHGPVAPTAPGTAQATPGQPVPPPGARPAAPGAAQTVPGHPPLPERGQRPGGPGTPGSAPGTPATAQTAPGQPGTRPGAVPTAPGAAGPGTAQVQQGRPPLPERGQRPGGPTAPAAKPLVTAPTPAAPTRP
ncbi:DUF6600 domain-containing protein, partial [Inquilinus sp. 2KB_12]|uniref:DUF6600 domain-containing protein n=2 Tax=unclassified Inquilinus TaxID=2645927 RepID=UPI003F91E287